jgi:hypothetical protein
MDRDFDYVYVWDNGEFNEITAGIVILLKKCSFY